MEILYISLIIIAFFAGIVLLSFLITRSKPTARSKPSRERRAENNGELGEQTVAAILRFYAQDDDKILNDIYLFNPETGKSSQIDHIFISSAGIYVIETKNYSGDIYGYENQREWTQVLGQTETKFHSPVKQNATHIYLVKKIVGKRFFVNGIVVFVQGNIQNVKSDYVKSLSEFRNTLETLKSCHCLSKSEIEEAYQKIIQNRDSYQITKDEHLQSIRKTQLEIANNVCPRCGGKLLIKNGPYGQFYGCSNYPNCKFKKNIT